MSWSQRHYIIVPAYLQTQANVEAVKWDPDAGGGATFDSAALSSDGGSTITHYAASTLIDDAYVPANQGGHHAPAVLDAFYATAFYVGYRITEAHATNAAKTQGLVETVALFPYRWVEVGEGVLREIALQNESLIRYEPQD